MAPRPGRRPRRAGDDEPRHQVDPHRDHRQDECQLGQGGHGEAGAVGERAVELGEDRGRHRGERLVDVDGDAQCGPPDHGDGDGLSERSPQAEHCGADDARAYPGEGDLVGYLPVGHAQGRPAFLRERGYLQEEVTGGRGDDGHDHEGEHDARRQQALARADRVAEVAQHGDVGGMVGDDRIDVAGQPGAEGEDAPQADDDARDAGEDLDGEPEWPRDPAGRRSVRAKAAPMESGRAMTMAMTEDAMVPQRMAQAPNWAPCGCATPSVCTTAP